MNNEESAQADTGGSTPRQYRDDAVVLLRAVRATLADLLRQLLEGDGAALRDIVAKQAELESALKRVFEAETRYDDWMQRSSGGGDGVLDLDAARDEIGRRLDRLRAAAGAG
ncbi:MAG: hypothetical protein H3C51_12910 [Rubellimicrobium sp.]|nr:hypothetical protein [Rubellimicrobium sp.]